MFISVEEPTRSVRFHRGAEEPVAIATGAGFKTGQGDPEAAVRDLEDWLRGHFRVRGIHSRWSNEDFNSKDRITYTGRMQAGCDGLWTELGFGAGGRTGGTRWGRNMAEDASGVTHHV